MHDNTLDIHKIIIRYLDGSASLNEKKHLMEWLQSSVANRNDFVEIRDLWLSCDAALSNEAEINIALERLRNRIHHSSTGKRMRSKWQQIAAVILLLISIGYTIYTKHTADRTNTDIQIQNQLITAIGSKGHFVLPDSSVVWLNSGSKLIYPEHFDKNNRTVTLEGEAYFQVREDKTKPFVVKAGEMDIEVLGTSFNVSNYPVSTVVETVLLTGSIKATMHSINKEEILAPDQLLSYQKETGKTEINTTSSKYHIDWIKDRLVFDNDRLTDVIISLEGWYAVQIDCPKAFSDKHRLSFTVRGENLQEILHSMSFIIPIKYAIENNRIKITPK